MMVQLIDRSLWREAARVIGAAGLVVALCGPVDAEGAGTAAVRAAKKEQGVAQANFRTPPRKYRRTPQELNIYIEENLAKGDAALGDRAAQKLERTLQEVFSTLPAPAAAKLRRLRFYLMWGTSAPGGGRDSGMSYIREGEWQHHPHLDPQWNHVIVVYSASNLMYLDELWARKALMHELAHAWHISHWPEKHPPIYDAYQKARAAGLYENVKDYKGRVASKGYAATNQLEYFAELSAMYFVGGNYFPFDRAGLASYDSAGEEMVRRLWKL